jgi:GTP-binding protein Era
MLYLPQMNIFKSGNVGIFGKPNAGKSTLLNAILGEKLAIVSPKVQTTRHRILGILNEPDYQLIFSDTPGLLQSKYKLHEYMMKHVSAVKKDTDVVVFVADINDSADEIAEIFTSLKVNKPSIIVLNKTDIEQFQKRVPHYIPVLKKLKNVAHVIAVSALQKLHVNELVAAIVELMPEGPKYYDDETLTDRPMRFFVSEIIREKLFFLLDNELPYHASVVVRHYEEKNTLTKIEADIVVTRETQKGIILGANGSMIKEIGQQARIDIEKFIDRKVFLALKVKVRDWRNNDLHLKDYGY